MTSIEIKLLLNFFKGNNYDLLNLFQAVGVSNILYLRSDLPDDTFVTQNIDGLR